MWPSSVFLRIIVYALKGGLQPHVCMIILMPTEQKFPAVLFIMLYKVIIIFESVDEILKCDRSNESY